MIYRFGLLPIVLIVLGVLLLLKNFGLIDAGIWQTIRKLWPLILVFIGIKILLGTYYVSSSKWCRTAETRTLSLDVGSHSQADVRIGYGAGRLSIGTAATGKLLDGTFVGGVEFEDSKDGRVRLYSPHNHGNWFGWCDRPHSNWRVGITRELPLNLHVDIGAAESDLDLTDLKLVNFQLNSGASRTTVRLPRAAGSTAAQISAGAASVKLIIPEGVAARIQTVMVVGSTDIDQRRFPLSGGAYVSPNYETAANKIDITFKGGVGSLQIS
jgi:hypothetical protein